MDGVVRTRVGYTGGSKRNPTYRSLGDHTESIQIDYDPTRISYDEVLDTFWSGHNPNRRAWSRQYMSAVFYHDEEQKQLALKTRAHKEKLSGQNIHTQILSLTEFYVAEDYHQKYQLRQHRDLMIEFKKMYPTDEDFVNSTAAARINGYLGGYGSIEALKEDLDNLGLSPAGRQELLALVRKRRN